MLGVHGKSQEVHRWRVQKITKVWFFRPKILQFLDIWSSKTNYWSHEGMVGDDFLCLPKKTQTVLGFMVVNIYYRWKSSKQFGDQNKPYQTGRRIGILIGMSKGSGKTPPTPLPSRTGSKNGQRIRRKKTSLGVGGRQWCRNITVNADDDSHNYLSESLIIGLVVHASKVHIPRWCH